MLTSHCNATLHITTVHYESILERDRLVLRVTANHYPFVTTFFLSAVFVYREHMRLLSVNFGVKLSVARALWAPSGDGPFLGIFCDILRSQGAIPYLSPVLHTVPVHGFDFHRALINTLPYISPLLLVFVTKGLLAASHIAQANRSTLAPLPSAGPVCLATCRRKKARRGSSSSCSTICALCPT